MLTHCTGGKQQIRISGKIQVWGGEISDCVVLATLPGFSKGRPENGIG